MLSHEFLYNSGKSFFSISMTLALECGLLSPLCCTNLDDEPWYCDLISVLYVAERSSF